MFKRKVLSDVSLNFISSIIVLISIQLLLYPKISRETNAEFFGSFVFLMSIFNFVATVLGGTGNSLFMKNYLRFRKNNEVLTGYRHIITLIYQTFFISFVILFFYFNHLNYSRFDQVVFGILTLLITYRIYLISWFRVELKYREILLSNLVLSFSYILIFVFIKDMSNIFHFIIIAESTFTMTALYITRAPKLLLPKILKNNKTLYKGFFVLLISSILISGLKYLDRWFINTFMESELIAYFYVASITGSLFSIPFNTLSNVIFSYYIQYDNLSKKTLNHMLIILPVLPFILIVTGYFIGPVFISILYPEYYDESLSLFYILNIGYGVLIIDFLLRGFVIKFFDEKNKLLIDGISITFCILALLILTPFLDLKGVAIAFTLTFIVKSIIDYIYLIAYARLQI